MCAHIYKYTYAYNKIDEKEATDFKEIDEG